MSLSMESGMYRARFGSSVSVSADGSIFAVGAKDALNAYGVATGAVYLYSMEDSVYDAGGDSGIAGDISGNPTDTISTRGLATPTKATLLLELFGSEAADDEFGSAIALSRDGRRLVVGSRSENNEQNGAIRIYQRGEEDDDGDGVADTTATTNASGTGEDGDGVEDYINTTNSTSIGEVGDGVENSTNSTNTTNATSTSEVGDGVEDSTNTTNATSTGEDGDGVEDSTNTTYVSGTVPSRRRTQAGSTNSWTLMERGLIHGPNPSGRAGWAVSISSDGNGECSTECFRALFFCSQKEENTVLILLFFLVVVAMGSPGTNGGGGTIVTFRYKDGFDGAATYGWEQFGNTIEAPSTGEAAGYSISLDLTGLKMVIGFPLAKNFAGSADAGKAAVYFMAPGTAESFYSGTEATSDGWTLLGEEIFGESEGVMDGSSVAISTDGSIVVIGGRGHSVVNNATGEEMNSVGHCRVYQFGSDGWILQHTITGQAPDERLGTSVSVSRDGNVVSCGGVSGANGDSNISGVVRMWDRHTLRESTIWPRAGSGADTEGATFGESVALSGDGEYLLVGAPTWTTTIGGSAAGAIQMFRNR